MALHYRHLKLELNPNVYEPAEDSFLLAENITPKKGDYVLDVGTGTGILALVAAGKASKVLGVDINPEAVELARNNAKLNGLPNVESRLSDLFTNVGDRFDLIVFNPPYLPVKEDGLLELSWSGGERGVEVVERFLGEVKDYLKPRGRILMVASSLNGLRAVERKFIENGLSFRVLAEKKIPFEMLYVISSTL